MERAREARRATLALLVIVACLRAAARTITEA